MVEKQDKSRKKWRMTEAQLANLKKAKMPMAQRGKIGGVKSGESKREQKTFRSRMEYLLTLSADELEEISHMDAICIAMIRAAENGSTKAAEWCRDTAGQKPTERDNNTITGNVIVQWQQNNEGVNPAGVVVDNGKQQVSLDVPAGVPALAVNSNTEG